MANLDTPVLVLASGSPRRKRLLEAMGLTFTIQPADICEDALPAEAPRALVERLALAKAGAVAAGHVHPTVVLGSDTIVVLGEDVLGKPRDAEHAVELLGRLVGQTHQVLTGVALVSGDGSLRKVVCVESRVVMRPAEEDELRSYVATGEPLDKAGAYALQGEGRRFVVRVEGSETNVIGLPVDETRALLREAGFDPLLP
ncbi:MAG: septum formation inhibitor Maf [Deltaproteobacteria bacterium]|nr:septum formation inhibitor Maf [Deltaproteobacteria bacterium]MBW2393169.1 septum formation inhibitor Maf [Deltaproteobacteria bacterium]